MCYYRKEKPNDCYKEININVNNKTEIEVAIDQAERHKLSFIVLAGDSWTIAKFRELTGVSDEKMQNTFYLPFLTESRRIPESNSSKQFIYYDKGTVFSNFPGSWTINYLLYYVLDFPKALMDEFNKSKYYHKSIWIGLLRQPKLQAFFKKTIPSEIIKSLGDKNNYQPGDDFSLDLIMMIPESFMERCVRTLTEEEEMLLLLVQVYKRAHTFIT